jgi:hypothetical protein
MASVVVDAFEAALPNTLRELSNSFKLWLTNSAGLSAETVSAHSWRSLCVSLTRLYKGDDEPPDCTPGCFEMHCTGGRTSSTSAPKWERHIRTSPVTQPSLH